ncbi:MAG: hypothetical protein MGF17_01825 [Trichodesmium sp. MAG_R04]|nr:hypothetical protein [Trichodesmium sp. MAG_R04]
MIQNRWKQSQKSLTRLLVMILTTTALAIHPAFAQIKFSTIKQDTPSAKLNLQEGEVIFKGTKGQYTGYVIAKANLSSIWQALTDYDNFEKYMPNVVESNLLESRGNQKVFEQVQMFQLLMFTRNAKVKIVVTEDYPEMLTFTLVEGELKKLQGSWKIDQIDSNKYLITHQVTVEPNIQSRFNRDLFFAVYEDTVEKTLGVISQESERRSGL